MLCSSFGLTRSHLSWSSIRKRWRFSGCVWPKYSPLSMCFNRRRKICVRRRFFWWLQSWRYPLTISLSKTWPNFFWISSSKPFLPTKRKKKLSANYSCYVSWPSLDRLAIKPTRPGVLKLWLRIFSSWRKIQRYILLSNSITALDSRLVSSESSAASLWFKTYLSFLKTFTVPGMAFQLSTAIGSCWSNLFLTT